MGRHSSTPADELLIDWRSDRLGSARRGENPMVMAKVPSGYVVFGDTQHLPGYCVLLSDVDDADHLTDLDGAQRTQFLADMALLGDAVFAVCGGRDPAFRRLNYEILGNSLHHLHAHVHARYAWEPAEFRTGPVWRYPYEDRFAEQHDPLSSPEAEELDEVRQAITAQLQRLLKRAAI
jgi:diadenosine tetraphosphate (Ap4A) HIT family hydrolase